MVRKARKPRVAQATEANANKFARQAEKRMARFVKSTKT